MWPARALALNDNDEFRCQIVHFLLEEAAAAAACSRLQANGGRASGALSSLSYANWTRKLGPARSFGRPK